MDERRDPGEFYPGGRVIAREDVAPGQTIVNWSDIQGKPDFSDVAELGAADSLGTVKQTMNTVVNKFKTSLLIGALLAAGAALADVAPQTAALDDIPGNTPIMTNTQEYVDAKVGGRQDLLPYPTNAIPWDAISGSPEMPIPDFTTNNAELVETIKDTAPTPGNYAAVSNAAMNALSRSEAEAGFTEWTLTGMPSGATEIVGPDFVESEPPMYSLFFTYNEVIYEGWTDVSGEDVTSIVFDCSDVDDTVPHITVTATRTRLPTMADLDGKASTSDATLKPVFGDPATFSDWTILRDGVDVTSQVGQPSPGPIDSPSNVLWNVSECIISTDTPTGSGIVASPDVTTLSWFAYNMNDPSWDGMSEPPHVPYTATRARTDIIGYVLGSQTNKFLQPAGEYLGRSDLAGMVPTNRAVNGKSLIADIALDASDVSAYSAADGATLAGQVATIGAHLNAEDARFVVTNYNSVTHTPEAYVEIQLPDTSWSRIWSEMTRWNYLFDYFLPTNYYDKAAVNAALAEKADRAWGFYDSTTGEYAPDGYTWISSEKIAIAANLAYQRTVTTEGAIWVLESNGVTETGGMTNGFFRISDDEGNSLFEIVKGNKRTVGADASSCQVVAGFTPTKLQIGYSIVSDVHPTLYVCQSLATQDWKAETDSDCIANVTWSGTSGAYVAQVQGKSAYSSMFVKATYEVGGETYISNAAPVSMQYIMIGGVKYAVGVGTVSGTTVLTLTVAP